MRVARDRLEARAIWAVKTRPRWNSVAALRQLCRPAARFIAAGRTEMPHDESLRTVASAHAASLQTEIELRGRQPPLLVALHSPTQSARATDGNVRFGADVRQAGGIRCVMA